MSHWKRAALLLSLLCALNCAAKAQTAAPKEAAGIIKGRITVGSKPAMGTTVALTVANFDRDRKAFAQTLTDSDGRYVLKGIPAGRYRLRPLAPVYTSADFTPNGDVGKTVNLRAGETVEGMDFALSRGGVITGRVTDSEGRPVIEERVELHLINEGAPSQGPVLAFRNFNMYLTDDRGVYRLYGLPAGRYRVSVGADTTTRPTFNNPRGFYARTFHPDVTNEAKAEVIELAEGGEASGVDIKVSTRGQTYAVTGRVVDADNGKPVPHVPVSFGSQSKGGDTLAWFGGALNTTNENGDFRIEGFAAGRYAVFVTARESSDFYSDPVPFEVTDADVTGVEIKASRGASLSGNVVLENNAPQDVFQRLAQLQIYAQVASPGSLNLPVSNPSFINADGSFRLNGLRPGKAQLFLGGRMAEVLKNFTQVRVEREGVEQRDGIEVSGGEQVTNVRLVLAYGTGVLQGEIKSDGQSLPAGNRFLVQANRVGDRTHRIGRPSEVDVRGRFTIEGLPSGTYEVTVRAYGAMPPGARRLPPLKQIVSVTEGTETEVTFTLNSGQEKEQP